MPPPSNSNLRIPVKLHKQVALIRTADPILAEELLARKTLAKLVAGRLSDTVLLVRAEEEEAIRVAADGTHPSGGPLTESFLHRGDAT